VNKKVYASTAGTLILAILLLLAPIALAQSGDGYDLSWWTVDGGGETVNTVGNYTLNGTIGQPDAALWQDETYTLIGGFWGGAAVERRIYLPLVLRNF
jgi:hypothetical protein